MDNTTTISQHNRTENDDEHSSGGGSTDSSNNKRESSSDDNDIDTERTIDAGEIEIEDANEYHPDSTTSLQCRVLMPRSPIRTRARAKAEMSDAALIHYALSQLTLKDGLKKFGKKGQEAVKKELLQLHYRTFLILCTPIH